MNHIIPKPWGYEQILAIGTNPQNNQISKNLVVFSGQSISLQYHNKRYEKWIIKHGVGIVTIGDERYNALPETVWFIEPKLKHRIEALTDMVIFEASDHVEDDDIIRIEDKYGRI